MKAIWSWFRACEWDGSPAEPAAIRPHGINWSGPANINPPRASAMNKILTAWTPKNDLEE